VSPSKSAGGDASELDTSFPRDLAEALRVLERSTPLRRALGDAFVDVFVSVKRAELAHYEKEITRWEVSYLGSVL
jgi:glutamine synthetase